MKPVMQSIPTVDIEKGVFGDCFRACIASIFELSLCDVPHFVQLGSVPHAKGGELRDGQSHWWFYLTDWLRERDLVFFDLPYDGNSDEFLQALGYTIITGLSPRGEWDHCVVGYRGEIVHDPHPAGGGVRTRKYLGVFARTFADTSSPEVSS